MAEAEKSVDDVKAEADESADAKAEAAGATEAKAEADDVAEGKASGSADAWVPPCLDMQVRGNEDVNSHKVSVKKSLLKRAIKALHEWVAKKSANCNPLFDSASQTLIVLFSLTYEPEARQTRCAHLITLPHPLYDDTSEVCFFSKDPQKQYKELLLRQNKIPGLTKVISLEKLRKNYKTLEEKKALAESFDLFLCDHAIYKQLPDALGKIFYGRRIPLPVKMDRYPSPVPGITKVLRSVPLRRPNGSASGVKIGRCSMPVDELVDNAAVVINCGVQYFTKMENYVQKISVQATGAPALPVWRRPVYTTEFLNLQNYLDASSSAGSDTAGAGASETEITGTSVVMSPTASDSFETLSQHDTISETAVETLSEPDRFDETTGSELASPAQSSQEGKPKKGKKRRQGEIAKAEPAATSDTVPAAEAAADVSMRPPTPKMSKKAKAKAKPSKTAAET